MPGFCNVIDNNNDFILLKVSHVLRLLLDFAAHVKSSMMGCSLTVPIKAGRLSLGIWQVRYKYSLFKCVSHWVSTLFLVLLSMVIVIGLLRKIWKGNIAEISRTYYLMPKNNVDVSNMFLEAIECTYWRVYSPYQEGLVYSP